MQVALDQGQSASVLLVNVTAVSLKASASHFFLREKGGRVLSRVSEKMTARTCVFVFIRGVRACVCECVREKHLVIQKYHINVRYYYSDHFINKLRTDC